MLFMVIEHFRTGQALESLVSETRNAPAGRRGRRRSKRIYAEVFPPILIP